MTTTDVAPSYTTIFLLLMIVDGIFTMINLGVLLVMVKLYTEIIKLRVLAGEESR